MEKLNKNRGFFVGLSCLGIASLVGAFASPLEKLTVYSQKHKGLMDNTVEQIFIITENTSNYPYGFDKKKAEIKALVTQDGKNFKLGLLAVSMICAGVAQTISQQVSDNGEIETDMNEVNKEGKKQLLINEMKNKWAFADKSQQMEFLSTLKEFVGLYGGDETMDATELNETNKFTNAHYMLAEGHSVDSVVAQTWGFKIGTPEHAEMKEKFVQWQET